MTTKGKDKKIKSLLIPLNSINFSKNAKFMLTLLLMILLNWFALSILVEKQAQKKLANKSHEVCHTSRFNEFCKLFAINSSHWNSLVTFMN